VGAVVTLMGLLALPAMPRCGHGVPNLPARSPRAVAAVLIPIVLMIVYGMPQRGCQ
jgi:hypothetical protein